MFQGALDRSADKVFHFTSILRKYGDKLYLIPASTIADLKRKSPFFFFFYSCLFIVAEFLYGENTVFFWKWYPSYDITSRLQWIAKGFQALDEDVKISQGILHNSE